MAGGRASLLLFRRRLRRTCCRSSGAVGVFVSTMVMCNMMKRDSVGKHTYWNQKQRMDAATARSILSRYAGRVEDDL